LASAPQGQVIPKAEGARAGTAAGRTQVSETGPVTRGTARADFAVYADGIEATRLATTALTATPAVVCMDWSEFARSAEHVRAGGVILPFLHSSCVSALTRLREQRPLLPVVLVTASDPENLRRLAALPPVEAVLFTGEAVDLLPGALQRAAGRTVLYDGVEIIRATLSPSSALAEILVKACLNAPPVRTAAALATRVAGYSETWLRKRWRAEAAPGTSPCDFLRWLLAVHACQAYQARDSISSLARRMAADRETVATALVRTFGSADLAAVARAIPRIGPSCLRHILTNGSATC
jgi:DNA-binding NarL/FixJ family response regulator